jgi:transcription elongation factor GreB
VHPDLVPTFAAEAHKRGLRLSGHIPRGLSVPAAVVVDPAAPRPASAATRVFFGATVTYKDAAGLEHVVSIVGIDEVDLDRGYISWRSPLANALMKASAGDSVALRAPAKTEHLEIISVEYAPIPMDPFREPPGAQSTPGPKVPKAEDR